MEVLKLPPINLSMKFLILPFLFFILIASAQQPKDNLVDIEIFPDSYLEIRGQSNINSFTCTFDSKLLQREQQVKIVPKENQLFFINTNLSLPSLYFDCGNRGINRDFKDLVKADEFPEISIRLLDIDDRTKENITARVLITIAGEAKIYSFPVNFDSDLEVISGKWTLSIKDFNLEPPKKAFGIIVIKEEIEISFQLFLGIQT